MTVKEMSYFAAELAVGLSPASLQFNSVNRNFKIQFTINPHIKCPSMQWHFSLTVFNQNVNKISLFSLHITLPVHLNFFFLFYQPNNTWWIYKNLSCWFKKCSGTVRGLLCHRTLHLCEFWYVAFKIPQLL